ncbi:Protein of unknown function [Bacillus mycoides]|nr:Protein of unknown function [Bacillus mycoides]
MLFFQLLNIVGADECNGIKWLEEE